MTLLQEKTNLSNLNHTRIFQLNKFFFKPLLGTLRLQFSIIAALFILMFLFVNLNHVYSQQNKITWSGPERSILDTAEYLVSYELIFNEDSTNTEDSRHQDFHLLIGEKKSMFLGINKFKADSISEIMKGQQFASFQDAANSIMNSYPRGRFNYIIYKNHPDDYITLTETFLDMGPAIYQEAMNTFKWVIDNSFTDTYNDYSVKKATTSYGGRQWTAYFAPDIPINDGPYKFHGLPGLILKIHDSEMHYLFSAISFEKEEHDRTIYFIKSNYAEITRSKSLQIAQNIRHNIINMAQEAQFPLEAQIRAAESMRRRNNPIELKAD